jgi:hypothetical protein
MFFTSAFVALAALASWTPTVAADLRITADHHSWGGVNYPMLQFFAPKHRDETIRELVAAKVRVVRLFSRFSVGNCDTLTHKIQYDLMLPIQM